MANISLPQPGQKPWSLNPAITAINAESTDTANIVNNGRLSASNLNATITNVSGSVAQATAKPLVDTVKGYAASFGTARSLRTRVTSSASDVSVPATEYTAIGFNTRAFSTGPSMWSAANGSTRMTAPADGLYIARGLISYASGPTDGTRGAFIRVNGGPYRGSMENNTSAVSTRATRVYVESELMFLREGDYVELCAYPVRGTGTLAVDVSRVSSWFEMEWVVERDAISRSESILFNANVKYNGWSAYQRVPANQNPERVFLRDDPIIGPARQVIDVTTTTADDSVLYPRNQFQSGAFIANGDDVYIGFGVYIPGISDFNMPDGLSGVIHEQYGPPFGGYGPNVIRLGNDGFRILSAGSQGDLSTPQYSIPAWSMSINGLRGRWIDIVHRIKSSSDPAVGFHELWVNTGNGFVQQSFVDPATGVSTGTRRYLATRVPNINDGGNNFTSLKLAWGNLNPTTSARLLYANHRVADTLANADPGSYKTRV